MLVTLHSRGPVAAKRINYTFNVRYAIFLSCDVTVLPYKFRCQGAKCHGLY